MPMKGTLKLETQTKEITMAHAFLPDGFESMKMEKPYWRLAQMKEGDNKLRIVTRPIAGWVDWQDNKPLRYRPEERPKSSVDPLKPFKAFWACYVWDYARESLFILEITQGGVLKALSAFGGDADWGDFTKYDIKIKKEGQGKDTKYHVTPMPHKPLSEAIEKALKSSPVRLEALYDGGDPWNDLNQTEAKPRAKIEPLTQKDEQLFDTVADLLTKSGDDGKKLQNSFLKAYGIGGLIEASDSQLEQLRVRLIEVRTQQDLKTKG